MNKLDDIELVLIELLGDDQYVIAAEALEHPNMTLRVICKAIVHSRLASKNVGIHYFADITNHCSYKSELKQLIKDGYLLIEESFINSSCGITYIPYLKVNDKYTVLFDN